MTEKDAATILEDAADYLLIHGVRRDGKYGEDGGPRCAVGAIASVSTAEVTHAGRMGYGIHPAVDALADHLWAWDERCETPRGVITGWNDRDATDDFEVIDTLRHVAKSIRNGEAQS